MALARSVASRGADLLYNVRDRTPDLANAYDLLLLFDVIEHIEDVTGFLESSLYHLKPGGWLFVNVPALPSLFSAYDRAAGHVRRYERGTLCRELACPGLSLRDLRYWGFTLLPLAAARTWFMGKGAPSDVVRQDFGPPGGALGHGGLKALMRLETALLRTPGVGTSLLAAAIKEG